MSVQTLIAYSSCLTVQVKICEQCGPVGSKVRCYFVFHSILKFFKCNDKYSKNANKLKVR